MAKENSKHPIGLKPVNVFCATNITEPLPIFSKEVNKLMTKTGVVLRLLNNKIDPTLHLEAKWV